MVFDVSVLNKEYNFVRVYPSYKQSRACAIDLICQVKFFLVLSEKKSNDYNMIFLDCNSINQCLFAPCFH